MKKILLALIVLSSAAFNAFAQTSTPGKFSLGLETGLPVGAAADFYSFAVGGSLKYDHPVGERVFVNVSVGYTSLIGKTINIPNVGSGKVNAFGVVPIKAGLKYFFDKGFYGEAQAGASFAASTSTDAGTAFLYSPGIGYTVNENFDIGIRYEAWSNGGTTSIVGVRLAYCL